MGKWLRIDAHESGGGVPKREAWTCPACPEQRREERSRRESRARGSVPDGLLPVVQQHHPSPPSRQYGRGCQLVEGFSTCPPRARVRPRLQKPDKKVGAARGIRARARNPPSKSILGRRFATVSSRQGALMSGSGLRRRHSGLGSQPSYLAFGGRRSTASADEGVGEADLASAPTHGCRHDSRSLFGLN